MTFAAYIGSAIRQRREAAGWSQDQLAERLRVDGLTWYRSAVAAIEAGDREPTLSELVLVADVLGFAVMDLFGAARRKLVGLTDVVFAEPGTISLRVTAPPERWGRALQADKAAQEAAVQRVIDGLAGSSLAKAWRISATEAIGAASETRHEAVIKAAKSLERTPLEVAVASRRIWNRGFIEERDLRLQSRLAPGATARTKQAIRGRITRDLLTEIVEKLPKFDEGAQ